jgi:membrane protease YdiL (CAAX protease family)
LDGVNKTILALSPFGIIALGHLTARIAGNVWGVWAWIPLTLVLWSLFAWMIFVGGGKESMRRWLRALQGSWGWSLLCIAVGLIPFGVFLSNWQLLSPISIWLPWLAFASINPFLEEGYWRGVLLDATAQFPRWVGIVYSSAMFALNHPLTFGVNSIANAHPVTAISTFAMGIVWALTYHKTKSLRVAVFAHILVDLLNLSIPAFLNLYVPPGFK